MWSFGGNHQGQQSMPMMAPNGMPMMPMLPNGMPIMPPGMPYMHPQQCMGMMPNMQGGPPCNSDGARDSRDRSRSPRRGSPGEEHRHGFADDPKKMSTSKKYVGAEHLYGEKCTPKKFRCTLANVCDKKKFPMLKVAQLCSEDVNLLNYCLAGLLPTTKMCDWNCVVKGEYRTAMKEQYEEKIKANASRLNMLAEDFDNLGMCAIRLGYPIGLMSPRMQLLLQLMRQGAEAARNTVYDGLTPSPTTVARPHRALALQDAAPPEESPAAVNVLQGPPDPQPLASVPSVASALQKDPEPQVVVKMPTLSLGRLRAPTPRGSAKNATAALHEQESYDVPQDSDIPRKAAVEAGIANTSSGSGRNLRPNYGTGIAADDAAGPGQPPSPSEVVRAIDAKKVLQQLG